MAVTLEPVEVIRQVANPLTGLPACIAGSSVSAMAYGLPMQDSSDVDVFCYSSQGLIAAVERLLSHGFILNDRFLRVWDRWLKFGFNSWHTNSIKLHGPASLDFVEINLVHKLLGGHPLNSMSNVLESFDFGLLGIGYDLQLGQFMDLRSFLFPGQNIDGPLPLMPSKRDAWRAGFISQYNGMREVGRYAKYTTYGYDLSLVKDDLIEGYLNIALYMSDRDDPMKLQLGKIYETIAAKIQFDSIDEMLAASKLILNEDSLDAIMKALE